MDWTNNSLDASFQHKSYFIKEFLPSTRESKNSDAMNLCYDFKLGTNDAIYVGMLEGKQIEKKKQKHSQMFE